MAAGTQYVPGLCNIGAAERRQRLRAAWAGTIAGIALFIILLVAGSGPWGYLLLLFPAFAAAIGFVQAAYAFCVSFGRRGIFNFADLGKGQPVTGPTDRARDRATSLRLTGLSVLIAAGVALIAFGLALTFA